MRKKIAAPLSLFYVTALLLSGCAAPACLSFLPITGSAYEGYVAWTSGEATKYYAFDIETTYRAVMRTSDQLKLETTVIKSVPKERYTLQTKGNTPMHIDIVPLEKGVTTVVINISAFGDKHYVELFYRLVDENLPRKAAGGKEKAP
ncbi:MAG: DUF3568 family protein [Syntrophales bacterium]